MSKAQEQVKLDSTQQHPRLAQHSTVKTITTYHGQGGSTLSMDEKLLAIDRILAHQLSPLETVVLVQMVKNSGTDHVCYLSKYVLASLVDVDRNTIARTVNRLAEKGYVAIVNDPAPGTVARHIPYPYCENLIMSQDENKPQSRLAITTAHGQYILGMLWRQESALTLAAQDAEEKRDAHTRRETLKELDTVFELKDALDRFVQRSAKK